MAFINFLDLTAGIYCQVVAIESGLLVYPGDTVTLYAQGSEQRVH